MTYYQPSYIITLLLNLLLRQHAHWLMRLIPPCSPRPRLMFLLHYITCPNETRQWPCLAHAHTVYPKKYAHGYVVLCFVVVMQSFIMNSHEVFIHIHQAYFTGTGSIVSPCITTTKHKPCAYFLGYTVHISGSFYLHGLTLIPPWICNYISYKIWYEITFSNFNGCTGDRSAISSHTSLGVRLLIHAGIKVQTR